MFNPQFQFGNRYFGMLFTWCPLGAWAEDIQGNWFLDVDFDKTSRHHWICVLGLEISVYW